MLRIGRPAVPVSMLVALALLLSPALADASRDPTARETAQITRAAVAANGSRTQTVKVTDIVVSTEGPWARAVVSLYHESAPDALQMAADTQFYRSGGRWRELAGTSDREPPSAVASDLDLPGPGGRNTKRGLIILAIPFALLLAAALVYRIRHPPPPPPPPPPPRPPPSPEDKETLRYVPGRPPCMACGGSKVTRCTAGCDGGGAQPNPNNPDTLIWVPCPACGGRREWPCEACRGTGKQP